MRLAEAKTLRAIETRLWTAEEDGLLKRLLLAGSTWDTILEEMPHRNRGSVYARIKVRPRLKCEKQRSHPSQTEHKISLTEATHIQGRVSKSHFAENIGESYLAHWTSSKDHLLVKLKSEGNSWRNISRALPGRSASAAEARWLRMQQASETTSVPCA
jgi:hypothetical protein